MVSGVTQLHSAANWAGLEDAQRHQAVSHASLLLWVSLVSPHVATWAYRWEGAEVWSVDVLKQVVCWILANSQCEFWDLIILLFLICSAFSGLSPSSGDYHQGWGRRCRVTGCASPGELDRASVTFHWEMCMAGRQQKQHWSELIRKWGNWDEWTPFTQSWL